jgi:hypothetical protein
MLAIAVFGIETYPGYRVDFSEDAKENNHYDMSSAFLVSVMEYLPEQSMCLTIFMS